MRSSRRRTPESPTTSSSSKRPRKLLFGIRSPNNHPCPCDWGEDCGKLYKELKRAQHPLGGFVKLNYSTTCTFQNTWHSIMWYLNPGVSTCEIIKNDFEKFREDGKKKPGGQKAQSTITFCKHHWDLKLVEFQNSPGSGNWTSPLTADQVKALGIYSNLSGTDKGILFDPSRGDGMTPCAQKTYKGEKLYIKAPNASKEAVIGIWNEERQLVLHPVVEKKEAKILSPAELQSRLDEERKKNVSTSREIEKLTAQVAELKKQLAAKDKQLEDAKAVY